MTNREVYDLIENGDLENFKLYVENCKVEKCDYYCCILIYMVTDNHGFSMMLLTLIRYSFDMHKFEMAAYLVETFLENLMLYFEQNKSVWATAPYPYDTILNFINKTIKKLELLKSV